MIKTNIERSKATSLEKIEEIFRKIEEKTKLNRSQILKGIVTSFILIWFGILDIYISYFLTIYYPVIWSVKIIERKDQESRKQWLTYWVVFSLFVILDIFSKFFISMIPFYFVIRTTILMWMALPNFKGALIVYNLLFVEIIKITKKNKFLEKIDLKNSLKYEVEVILKERNTQEKEIIFEQNLSNHAPVHAHSSSLGGLFSQIKEKFSSNSVIPSSEKKNN
jgi:receptor expression-enhancing protein 5/6